MTSGGPGWPESDPKALIPERLDAIKRMPRPLASEAVDELLGHIDALEDRITVVNQYYEEFLIPEIEKGGWATQEDQRRGLAGRKSGRGGGV